MPLGDLAGGADMTPALATSCAALPPEGARSILGAAQRWNSIQN
jgi:hypothetical protein